ncbi:MAG: phosphatase PAP2 family protein [Bacteroidetes bacterium]|nr:phosphatase PAP2 family protein [Bacteroidota bacterium]
MYFGKEEIFFKINRSRAHILDQLMPYITYIGDGWFAAIAIGLCSFIPIKNQLNVLVSWVICIILIYIFKFLVFEEAHRPVNYFFGQPEKVVVLKNIIMHSSNSFPSGHTTSAFAVLGSVALYFKSHIIKFVLFLTAVCVGWSRIYLGQHFVEDVLFGALLGSVSIFIAQILLKKIKTEQTFWAFVASLLKTT